MKQLKTYTKQVNSFGRGWGCGYVVIPSNHSAYILASLQFEQNTQNFYFQIPNFNQEITYCDFENDILTIGFDTSHSWNKPSHNEEYVINQTELLKIAVDNITLLDVQKYKNQLIEQKLNEIKELLK